MKEIFKVTYGINVGQETMIYSMNISVNGRGGICQATRQAQEMITTRVIPQMIHSGSLTAPKGTDIGSSIKVVEFIGQEQNTAAPLGRVNPKRSVRSVFSGFAGLEMDM